MRKKVLGLILSTVLFSTIGAFAQEKKDVVVNGDKIETTCKQGKRICNKAHKPRINPFEGIQLTAEQQNAIDKLRQDRKVKREADKLAHKEAKKKIKEDFNSEVEKILTPEQYQQYKTNCENIALHRQDKMKKKVAKRDSEKKGDKKKDKKKNG